jgi:hypothetical protein
VRSLAGQEPWRAFDYRGPCRGSRACRLDSEIEFTRRVGVGNLPQIYQNNILYVILIILAIIDLEPPFTTDTGTERGSVSDRIVRREIVRQRRRPVMLTVHR